MLDIIKQMFYNKYGEYIMEKQILHVDVNNAFLSWLAVHKLNNREKIDIRDQVSVIGGDETQRAGIVLAKSSKAKQFGIITGETLYSARNKCSNLKVYQGDYRVYKEYSDKLYNLLLEYTDKIERFSIDECFLDMTNYLMNDTLINKAKEINRRVKEELGFTVNVGVSNNKLLAKMASDFTKPDKVHTLFKDEIKTKMWNLPISDLFMIGKKTVPKLYNMKIKTIGDLAKTDEKILIKKFGKHGKMMWEYANGIDESEVQYKKEKPKSIGNSVTLPMDLFEIEKIEKVLIALVEQVSYRLRKENLLATVVNVQLRTKDFKDISHQSKLDEPTSNTKNILNKSKKILEEMFFQGMQIRLIGVRVDNLVEEKGLQVSLFSNNKQNDKQKKLDKAIDELKDKYGYNLITRANKIDIGNIVKIDNKRK